VSEESLDLARRAFRGQKVGIYERILCQRLILSTAALPLKAVQLVSNAGLMVPLDKLIELEIDVKRLELLSLVSNALINPARFRHEQYGAMVLIEWGFPTTEESYTNYIEPWSQGFIYQAQKLRQHVKWYLGVACSKCHRTVYQEPRDTTPEELNEYRSNVDGYGDTCEFCGYYHGWNEYRKTLVYDVIKEPLWSFFFDATESALLEQGYHKVVNSFTSWALPIIQRMSRKLAGLVAPQVYDEMMKTMSKGMEPEDEP
jgi:hypothetical protein